MLHGAAWPGPATHVKSSGGELDKSMRKGNTCQISYVVVNKCLLKIHLDTYVSLNAMYLLSIQTARASAVDSHKSRTSHVWVGKKGFCCSQNTLLADILSSGPSVIQPQFPEHLHWGKHSAVLDKGVGRAHIRVMYTHTYLKRQEVCTKSYWEMDQCDGT